MKKGFTLMELLATLVIIGLISTIVITSINKTLENNKIDLCNSQIENIISSTLLWKSDNQLYLPTSDSANTKVSIEDLIDGKVDITLDYKTLVLSVGFLKEEGYIEEKCENDICFADVYDPIKKEYISEDTVIEITKNNNKYDINVDYVCRKQNNNTTGPMLVLANSDKTYKGIVYLDPTDLNKNCTESNSISTTGTKTGCMKWYVYEEDDDTYTMILDHNTTDKVAWNSNDSVNNTDIKLKEDTANWNTILNTRLITVDEIAHIVGADREDTIKWNSSKGNGTDDIETKVSWFYFDGSGTSYSTTDGWQKPVATSKGESRYAWLFDYTSECAQFGCDIEDSSTAGYWTSTLPNIASASNWLVNRHGYIMYSSDSTTRYGIRPVITVNKNIFD